MVFLKVVAFVFQTTAIVVGVAYMLPWTTSGFRTSPPRTLFVRLHAINSSDASPNIQLSVRKRQHRRSPKKRRPRYYWADVKNIEAELRSFWRSCNVTVPENAPPPIPNESLLNYFERHDLRWAISSQGGREYVSRRLGGAMIMPGKWKEALEFCPDIMEELYAGDGGIGLPRYDPPSNAKSKTTKSVGNRTVLRKWAHREGRKPKGYWDKSRVINELIAHLDQVSKRKNRPPSWMPRMSELSEDGRDDLKGAIARFGGCKEIGKLAGLVPYHEWQYFESQFEFLLELRRYLKQFEGGDEHYFPPASQIFENGYDLLCYQIQQLGGRNILASRLGMSYELTPRVPSGIGPISFGPFSLDFGIRLHDHIRKDLMLKRPPLKYSSIQMPSIGELERRGETVLAAQVVEFGGAENVARRLGFGLEGLTSSAR